MKIRLKSRIFAFAVTLAMLLTMLPAFSMPAMAVTGTISNETELANAFANGGEYDVVNSINVGNMRTTGTNKNVILNMGSATITGVGVCPIQVAASSSLTINGGGRISGGANQPAILVSGGLTINGSTSFYGGDGSNGSGSYNSSGYNYGYSGSAGAPALRVVGSSPLLLNSNAYFRGGDGGNGAYGQDSGGNGGSGGAAIESSANLTIASGSYYGGVKGVPGYNNNGNYSSYGNPGYAINDTNGMVLLAGGLYRNGDNSSDYSINATTSKFAKLSTVYATLANSGTVYAVNYYTGASNNQIYQTWNVGAGNKAPNLGITTGTSFPTDTNRTCTGWVTSPGGTTAFGFDNTTINGSYSIYPRWRENTAFDPTTGLVPSRVAGDTLLKTDVIVKSLYSGNPVNAGLLDATSTFGNDANISPLNSAFTVEFDMSVLANRKAAYDLLKESNPLFFTANYDGSGTSATNPWFNNIGNTTLTMQLNTAQKLFLNEDTVTGTAANGYIAVSMAPLDSNVNFQQAVATNPAHMVGGKSYTMSIQLQDLSGAAPIINHNMVKWYKRAVDNNTPAVEFTATTTTVSKGLNQTIVSAPITVEYGYNYFAVVQDTKFINSDPACVTADIAGCPAGTKGLKTGDTSKVSVVTEKNSICSGELKVAGSTTPAISVGQPYTLAVDADTVRDNQKELIIPENYIVTYQVSADGGVWTDLANGTVTPLNTTYVYRAKISPETGSGLWGDFYTNLIRPTTLSTENTLTISGDNGTGSAAHGFDYQHLTLNAKTNTGDIGEVVFYQKIQTSIGPLAIDTPVWQYLATVPVREGIASYELGALDPQTYDFKAEYLANNLYAAKTVTYSADSLDGGTGDTYYVISSAIKPNDPAGTEITATPALEANVASTLSLSNVPMDADDNELTYLADFTVTWYQSIDGGPWTKFAGTADEATATVTPQSKDTMYYAEIAPAGIYRGSAFETNPIGGDVTKVATTTTLTANPISGKGYENGVLTLTATVADAVGGKVDFYVNNVLVGSAPLFKNRAIIETYMPVNGADISAVYSGNNKFETSQVLLGDYGVISSTLPPTGWVISAGDQLEVGKQSTLSLTPPAGFDWNVDYVIRWEVNTGTGGWTTLANSATAAVVPGTTAYQYRAIVLPKGDYSAPAEGCVSNSIGFNNITTKATSVELAVSDINPFLNKTIKLTATVKETGTNTVATSGFVTFKAGNAVVNTAPVGRDGKASITAPAPTTADTAVNYTAEYTGDNIYGDSVSIATEVTSKSVTIQTATNTVIVKVGSSTGAVHTTDLLPNQKYNLSIPVVSSTSVNSLIFGSDYTVEWYSNHKGEGWVSFASTADVNVTPTDDFYEYKAVVTPKGSYSLPAGGIILTQVAGSGALTPCTVTLSYSTADGDLYEGQELTLTATLDQTAATGTVDFFVDNVFIGKAPVVTQGDQRIATLKTTLTKVGDNAIKATYSGDKLYTTDSDENLNYTVKAAAIALHGTANTITINGPDGGVVDAGDMIAGLEYTLTAPNVYAADNRVSNPLAINTNYTIQWQSSPDGQSWNDIAGEATNQTVKVKPQTSSDLYRCLIKPVKSSVSPFYKPTGMGIVVATTGETGTLDTTTTMTLTPMTQYEGQLVKLTAEVKDMTAAEALVQKGTVTFYRCDERGEDGVALGAPVSIVDGKATFDATIKAWSQDGKDYFYATYNANETYATSSSAEVADANNTVGIFSAVLAAPTFTITPATAAGDLQTNKSYTLTLGPVEALDGRVLDGMITSPYSIKWQQSSDNGTTWKNIDGAEGRTYAVPNNTPKGTQFRVEVKADGGFVKGTAVSTVATVKDDVASGVALTPSVSETYENSKIALTAKVTQNTGAAMPTGTVAFYAGTTASGTPLTTLPLDSNGQAILKDVVIPAWNGAEGAKDRADYTVKYSGDGVYQASVNSTSITVRSTEIAVPTFDVFNADGKTPVEVRTNLNTNTAYVLSVKTVARRDGDSILDSTTEYSIQWQSSVNNGTSWTDIAGATDKTYVVPVTTQNGTSFRLVIKAQAGAFVQGTKASTDNAAVGVKGASATTLTTNVPTAYEFAKINLTAKVAQEAGAAMPTGTATFYLGTELNHGAALATVPLDNYGQAVLLNVDVPAWNGAIDNQDTANYFVEYSGDTVYDPSNHGVSINVKSTKIANPTFLASAQKGNTTWTPYTANANGLYTMLAGLNTRFELGAVKSLSGEALTAGKDYTIRWELKNNGQEAYAPISGATVTPYIFTAGSNLDSYIVRIDPVLGAKGNMLTGADSSTSQVATIGVKPQAILQFTVDPIFNAPQTADAYIAGFDSEEMLDGSHFAEKVVLKANLKGEVDLIADGGYVLFYDGEINPANIIGTGKLVATETSGGSNKLEVTATCTVDSLSIKTHNLNARFVPGIYYEGTQSGASIDYKVWSTTMETKSANKPAITAYDDTAKADVGIGKTMTVGNKHTLTLGNVYTESGERMMLGTDYYINWEVSNDSGANYKLLSSTLGGDSTKATVEVTPTDNKFAYRAVVVPIPASNKLDYPVNGYTTNLFATAVGATTTTINANLSEVYFGNDVTISATIDPATLAGKPTGGDVYFFYSTEATTTDLDYQNSGAFSGHPAGDSKLTFLNKVKVGEAVYSFGGELVYSVDLTTDKLPLNANGQHQKVYLYAYFTGNQSTNASSVINTPKSVDVYSSAIYGDKTGDTTIANPEGSTAGGIVIWAAGNTLVGDGSDTTLNLKPIYTLDAWGLGTTDLDKTVGGIEEQSKITNALDYTITWQYTKNYKGANTTWDKISSGVNDFVVVAPNTTNYAYRAVITAVPSDKTIASGKIVYYSNVLKVAEANAVAQMLIAPASSYIAANIDGSGAVDPFIKDIKNSIAVDAYISGGTNTPTGAVQLEVINAAKDIVFNKNHDLAVGSSHNQFQIDNLPAGVYTFRLTYTGNSGYKSVAPLEQYIVRYKPNVTLNLTGFPKVYDGVPADVSAGLAITAKDGGTLPADIKALAERSVTYRFERQNADGSWTWVDKAIDAGHYQVKAILPESEYYIAAESAFVSFDINQRVLTIGDIVYQSKTYDTTNTAYPLSVELTNVVIGDSVFVTGEAKSELATAGNSNVIFTPAALNGPDKDNYSLPVVDTESYMINRNQILVDSSSIAGKALNGLKVYDASGRAMILGKADGYSLSYYYHDGSGVKLTTDLTKNGKYTVVVAPTDCQNFKGGESFVMNVGTGSVSFSGNDTQASAIPTLINFTGTQFEYQYDKQFVGIEQSAIVDVTNTGYTYDKTNAKATIAGHHAATALAGSETQNGILNIFKSEEPQKLTPVVKVNGVAVSELTFGTSYTIEPLIANTPAGTYYTFVGGNIPGISYEQPKDAGKYLVTIHVPESQNYVAYTKSYEFTINKAKITITANDMRKLQYATNPRATASYDGALATDFGEYRDMLVLPSYTLPEHDDNGNVDLNVAGNYALIPGKAYSTNYDITNYIDGNFTVEAYTAAETFNTVMKMVGEPNGKIYYGDDFILSVYGNYGLLNSTSGAVTGNGENVTIPNSSTTKRINNSSVLAYEIIASSDLNGGVLGNADVATIDPLTGKVETQRSGYFTVKLTRGTGTDAIYAYKTYKVEKQGLGIYMNNDNIVTYTGQIQGLDISKYTTTNNLAIPAMPPTTVAYTGSGDTPINAGNYLVEVNFDGSQFTGHGYGLLVIQPKEGTVKSNAATKEYGATIADLNYTVDGAVNNVGTGAKDLLLNPVGLTKANLNEGSDVGQYEIFTAGGEVNPNYILKYVSADYAVKAKTLTVEAGTDLTNTYNTFTALEDLREYGTVNPQMGYKVSGFVTNDGLADLMISGEADKAFVSYARVQESDANRSGANHANYVNDYSAGDGYGSISLYNANQVTNKNSKYLNYTITNKAGLLDIYQVDAAITAISLTVPENTPFTQKNFFSKVVRVLSEAPMSDSLADLGIVYNLGGTPFTDRNILTTDNGAAISITLKNGTKASPQNYWADPLTNGTLTVLPDAKAAVINLGRTSSSADISDNITYLPVYKWTDGNGDAIKDKAEMTSTGWYVKNDAYTWASGYNSVGSAATNTTATYDFLDNAGNVKFAQGATIGADGDYNILNGDTNVLTKTQKVNIGDLKYYIFDASGNVVNEGIMPADSTKLGVYGTGAYTALADGTYTILLVPKNDAIKPYTTVATLGGTNPPGPNPPPISGGGNTEKPILETEDHFAYIIGDENDNFNATVNMTRAEAATVFYRLLKDQSYKTDIAFTDVAANEWYSKPVAALAAKGIIKGYDTGDFKPTNPITRAEFCAMASRFFNLSTEKTLEFNDVAEGHWAYEYIMSAATKGWVNGYKNSDGTFSFMPDSLIKRAEVVKIVNAMLDRSADKTFVEKNADKLAQFNDLTSTYWAYLDIMEAANGHIYTMDKNGAETWSKLK